MQNTFHVKQSVSGVIIIGIVMDFHIIVGIAASPSSSFFCHQRCHKPSHRNCRPLHRGFRLATSISNSASITTIIVVSLFVTEASASAPASVSAFRYRSNETCYTMLWTPEQLLLALSPSAAPAKVISVAVFTLIEAGSILRHRGKLALYSLCGFD